MIKTKVYFFDENKIKSKEDYLIVKLRTGTDLIDINDNLNNKITNKFIKFGIYHSELLNNTSDKEYLFFNKERFCQLLSKNTNVLKLSKPGVFSNKLKQYINQLDSIIYALSQYFIEKLNFEKDITENIEYLRHIDIEKCRNLSQLFVDYRNFIFNLRIVIYDELINFYHKFKKIENNLKSDKSNILADINDFINVENKYIIFNDEFESKINFYDNRFIVTEFSDHEKIKKFIINFDLKLKSAFNEII